MAAYAAAIAHVQWMMRVVLMPVMRARSMLSDVARIALPVRVRFRNRYSAPTSAIAVMPRNMLSGGMRMSNGNAPPAGSASSNSKW